MCYEDIHKEIKIELKEVKIILRSKNTPLTVLESWRNLMREESREERICTDIIYE